MFNVQGYLDGAMERSFSTVSAGGRPVRPGLPLLTPRKLIETATITAARVLGLGDRIGSLTPGKRADIVLIRKGPFGDSVVDDACAHVLLQTSPRDIDTVLVDGKVRMKGGRAGRASTPDGRRRWCRSRESVSWADDADPLSPVRQDRRRQVDPGAAARSRAGDAADQRGSLDARPCSPMT